MRRLTNLVGYVGIRAYPFSIQIRIGVQKWETNPFPKEDGVCGSRRPSVDLSWFVHLPFGTFRDILGPGIGD